MKNIITTILATSLLLVSTISNSQIQSPPKVLGNLEGKTAQCSGNGDAPQGGAAYPITAYARVVNGTTQTRLVASNGPTSFDSGWRSTMYVESTCSRVMCAKTSWKIVNNVVSVSGESWNGGTFGKFVCHGAFPNN